MITETVTTDQLRAGDVVLNYGMRLLIDGPIKTYLDRGETVYHTSARVLNIEELMSSHDIDSFILAHVWDHTERYVAGAGWTKDRTAEPRWSIQGNHLARWSREASVSVPLAAS